MRKSLSIPLLLVLFLVSTISTSIAGSRYYDTGYGRHHYKSYSHHRSHHHGHSYHSDRIWAHLGVGLLTGAVLGSVLYTPPRQRTIVYNNPPPVVVYSDPVVVRPQYVPRYSNTQVSLRQIKTTPNLLNIRSGPDTGAPIVGQLQRNTFAEVLGAAPEWIYIRTDSGQYGWVMTKYTQEAAGPVG